MRLLILWLLILAVPSAARADRIILRDLEVITGKQVTEFNEDGVRLDDGSRLRWDQIERGTVSADRQAAFDRMLQQLGTQLYRIRQRLSVGDYRGLLTEAESLYPLFVGRDSETAYLVTQSLMWARLAQGQREAAVEPYIRCFEFLRRQPGGAKKLPGDRSLQYDPATGMSDELLPVWFDAEAARQMLPGVLKAVAEMPEPRPEGLRIYYGTLALTAGDWETARTVLAGVQGQQKKLAELLIIAVAQGEVLSGQSGRALPRLANQLDQLDASNRPLGLYWLGRSKLASADPTTQQEGILQLLNLPALYGEQHPDLAAAALYESMLAYARGNQPQEQASIRRELLNHYNQTYHAVQVRTGLSRKSDP